MIKKLKINTQRWEKRSIDAWVEIKILQGMNLLLQSQQIKKCEYSFTSIINTIFILSSIALLGKNKNQN